ncbi:MAG: hypothetical protein ABW208_17605 [Pyrinomonadaceae bacterium]
MGLTTPEEANIGPRERRKRRLFGIVSLTAGVAAAFVLVVFGASRWWRLVVFPLIWMAGLGLLQAREKTCIALAARGACNMDSGEVPVNDSALAARLREKAAAVHRRALFMAAAITVVVLAFPLSTPE